MRSKARAGTRSATPATTPTTDGSGTTSGVDERKDIPQPGSFNYDQRVRETLQTYLGSQGNPLDRGLTLRDLVASGVILLAPGYSWGNASGGNGGLVPGASGSVKPDLTPPPDVTGAVLTGGLANFFVETDPPVFTVGHGYLQTIVYGVTHAPGTPLPTFSNAQEIFTFSGEVGSYATSPATEWRIWLKWKTNDGVESVSPVGGTNGFIVVTGQDVDKLVTAMTGPGKPFTIVPVDTIVNGEFVPAGTYTSDAYIKNGSIVNAKIGNASIGNAKIIDLAVEKLRAGSISAGQFIQSSNFVSGSQGFHINANGYAEFQNTWVRGTVYANAGYFQGDIYASGNSIIKGDVSGATGTFQGGVRGGGFTGFGWPPAGGTGYFLGPGGLLLGNYNNGSWFQVNQDGSFSSKQLSMDSAGNATFTGTININSGAATRLVITSSQIQVWQNGVLRVRMGVW